MTGGDDPATAEEAGDDRPVCDEAGCSRTAGVVLHVPWDEDRAVCPAHARALARRDGIVAEPMDDADDEWP